MEVIAGGARKAVLTESNNRCGDRDPEGLGRAVTVISAHRMCPQEEFLHIGELQEFTVRNDIVSELIYLIKAF